MRISDWSSDVCSSDLRFQISLGRKTIGRNTQRILRDVKAEDIHRGSGIARTPERCHHPQRCPLREREISRLLVGFRSEEHTSELQSLMRLSYAVFCLQTKTLNSFIQSYISVHT